MIKPWKVDVTTKKGLKKAFGQLNRVLQDIVARLNYTHDVALGKNPKKKKNGGGGTDPKPTWPPP